MKKFSKLIRKSFGLKEQIRPQLKESYYSSLIERMKQQGFCLQSGRLTIRLAEEFGFCYGVDRAVDYAYETRAKFPDARIFLTNEIIHNPQVNLKLREMGVHFLSGTYAEEFSVADIRAEDIVIIPAFGTSIREMEEIGKRGCTLVDTTCGSVMSVWKRVESYARDGFTSVIHGKYDHEETVATSSRALRYAGGKFLVVRDKDQAKKICDYIEGRGNHEAFLAEFRSACSPGFDPDRDLRHIGCANQTTMLSSESVEIADMLQATMKRQYGDEEAARRFRHFDTICSATQERQNAVIKLAQVGVDFMIVVGGYNSSNTAHLVEISQQYCPSYHVQDASCMVSKDVIRHKKVLGSDIVETSGWLPDGKAEVGITAGASTPNRVIEEVIRRILQVASE